MNGKDMKKVFFAAVVFVILAVAPGFAQFNWQIYDFGTGPFDGANNYSPIDYPHGIGHLPSPGYLGEGGEGFDLEGFNYARVGNTIHVSLTNSFGLAGYSPSWDRSYGLGDIFFGVNGGQNQFAINVATGTLYEVGSWMGIPNRPGTYYGTSIASQVGAWRVTDGTNLGSINESHTFWEGLEQNPMQGDGDTHVFEFAFDASLLGQFADFSSINFSTTIECGNDLIRRTFPAVPEPSTFLLLGLGIIGLGVVRKMRATR